MADRNIDLLLPGGLPFNTPAVTVTLPLSDTVTVTDSRVSVATKVLTDTTTFADSTNLATTITLPLADSVTFTDARVDRVTKVLSDTATFTDSEAARVTKVLSDATTFTDVISGFSRTLNLSDTVVIDDIIDVIGNLRPLVVGGADAAQGPVTGGGDIALVGLSLDESEVEDRFTNSVINPILWASSVLTGSGSIRSLPHVSRGVLQLSTGLGTSSSAYLRSAMSYALFDVETNVRLSGIQLRSGDAQAVYSLGAYVSSSTHLRAGLESTKAGSQLHIAAVQNNITLQDVTIPTRGVASLRLRLQRVREAFFVYLNDALVLTSTWIPDAALIEMGVTGTARASMTAAITKYVRNPVILFGTEPMTRIQKKTPDRLDGLVPAQLRPGYQTIHVHTDTATESLEYDMPTPYLYLPTVDFRRVGLSGPVVFTDISDTAVRSS